ncbi:MAG: hypothetical protein HN909_09420 [Phycisphaerales bacterium]|nr:hypothetical protein [Phycisphaerales bacterium]
MMRYFLSSLLIVSCLASVASAAEPSSGRREVEEGWFAQRTPPVAAPKAPKAVFVIPIQTQIAPALYDVLKYKITRARSQGADMIIFDMDTPGGRVDVMEDIMAMIREDLADIFTVCWVHPQAHSAGAMIALGCDEIVITNNGIIGDAMPIIITNQGLQPLPTAERSKAEAPLRAMVRDLAMENGYSADLCEGMIHTGIVLWVVRDRATKELKIVRQRDRLGQVDLVPGQPRVDDAKWDFVRLLDGEKQLVDLTTRNALYTGIAAEECDTLEEVQTRYGITGAPVILENSPLDDAAIFLNSPAVAGLLMTVMILTIFGEFRTPGIGVYGAIAALCLALIIGSKFLVGLANTAEVALFALGVFLLILEFFVIPGFGIAGIAGLILMAIAALAMLLPNAPTEFPWPEVPGDWGFIVEGVYTALVGLAVGVAGGLTITANARRLPLARRVVLDAPDAPTGEAQQDGAPIHRLRPGQAGVALSDLRPSGRAQFDTDVVDVIANGMAISRTTPISILRIDGNRIVVEPDTPSEA